MSKKKDLSDLFHKKDVEAADDEHLLLREEELDIAKDRFKSGEVTLHKDIVEEHKIVDVPVMHEEVAIERKALDHRMSDKPIGKEETIHIPLTEEKVEVGKHTEMIGEVSAHKRAVNEMRHVDEVLKKEKAQVDVDGHPKVISKDRDRDRH
jgi:uncharacterized protein (TIGR02271 family)